MRNRLKEVSVLPRSRAGVATAGGGPRRLLTVYRVVELPNRRGLSALIEGLKAITTEPVVVEVQNQAQRRQ